jgi:peroxiredoxin
MSGSRSPAAVQLSRRALLALPLAAVWTTPGLCGCASTPPRPKPNPSLANLPAPTDDGAARHLPGMALPDLALPSTANRRVNLSTVTSPRLVIYAYPMTKRPETALPQGWDEIPGARGCTAEACAFRDHRAELAALQAAVFGVSTQSTEYQQEMVKRLHVPFEILSDEQLAWATALRLPTFSIGGMTLLKRLTLIVRDRRIEHVFYPVFPADKHADEVIAWLQQSA